MDKTKIFNAILFPIILLLIFTSVLAIVMIHWKNSNYDFEVSPEGIDNYLTSLGSYKALFTATVATIAAYFGLFRLKAATDANKDKVRQDRFTEWKTVLEARISDIEVKNPNFKRAFIKIRFNLFKQLYDLNFTISNSDEFKKIFENHFKNLVAFLESQNVMYNKFAGIYAHDNYTYALQDFHFVFLGCIDDSYGGIYSDIEKEYIKNLPKDRLIDHAAFKSIITQP